MKVYMIEWWDQEHFKHHQEYYTSINWVSYRVKMLEEAVPASDPHVSTIVVNTDE
jgi:hypothetical protein